MARRYAVLSDIHSNLSALQAVFKDVEAQGGVDGWWILGDIIVYGPDPIEVVKTLYDLLGEEGWLTQLVLGNNDYDVIHEREPDEFNWPLQAPRPASSGTMLSEAADVLPYRTAVLATQKWTRDQLEHSEGNLLALVSKITPGPKWVDGAIILHASPCEPIGIEGNYLRVPSDAEEAIWCLSRLMADQVYSEPVCFFGHTHLPTIFKETTRLRVYQNVEQETIEGDDYEFKLSTVDEDCRVLINPGSVGQPRNRIPKAHYALYDAEARTVRLRRVSYDFKPVMDRLTRCGVDDFLERFSPQTKQSLGLLSELTIQSITKPSEILAYRIKNAE